MEDSLKMHKHSDKDDLFDNDLYVGTNLMQYNKE